MSGGRHRGRLRRALGRTNVSTAIVLLSLLAGCVVFLVATELFPYHSSNHDEGVYLQQAALLLDGKLWLTTAHPEAFRPWFFVRDGLRLYPKYSPVPAAVFAPALAIGVPRLSLALVAAGNTMLVASLAREAFDVRTGVLAALLLLASPLFVLTSSVFLPYAPTALFEFAFALCYVRAVRRTHLGYAVLAGVCVGIAFFARPYTTLLFSLPFVLHACWTLARTLLATRSAYTGPTHSDHTTKAVLVRYLAIALPALAFVGVALAYNRVVTGAALRFPYEAFAPLDGLGFGRRRLLGYEVQYSPRLALRANTQLLREFATRWTAAAPFGTVFAAVGVASTLAHTTEAWFGDRPGGPALPDRHVQWLLVGVLVSVAVGNVYFWGNLNVIETIDDPTDGFIAQFGPYYHFDTLLPLSAFGAAGVVRLVDRVRTVASTRLSTRATRALVLALVVVSAPVIVTAERDALAPPIAENAAFTERYESAYAPFEERDLGRALVFVPTPYGDWLAHPFQSLWNGPSLGGERVYALDGGRRNLALVRDFPNRTPYRFTYRGEWGPEPTSDVVPHLQRLRERAGTRHRITTTVGVPSGMDRASVRLESDAGAIRYTPRDVGGRLAVDWVLTPDGARAVGDLQREGETASVPLGDGVALAVTFVGQGGATVTYRQELTVDVTDGRVRLLWPPETEVCRLTTDCGNEGTYVPGAGEYLDGVSVNTTLETGATSRAGNTTTSR